MRKLRWAAVAMWMIVIFAFSHQPYSGRETEKYLGDANVPVRKAGHISEYMILYWLVRWALQKKIVQEIKDGGEADTVGGDLAKSSWTRIVSQPTLLAFLITLAYAASDEWHQSYVPGRSASLADVTWDTSGIALGMILSLSLSRFQKTAKTEAKKL